MQRTLDLSIKKAETGTLDGGFTVENGKEYSWYADNDLWESFKDDMEKNHPEAFKEYGAGSGGEMKYNGKTPPKMASYGSSSRMIYELSKDVEGFRFEYKLPTRVGGVANLDGFLEKEDRYIFVEAKCREPYGKKQHLIEVAYRDLYRYINEDDSCNLNIKTEDAEKKMKVEFSVDDCIISSFDIKQMICHLLGVAMKFLENPTDKKISFIYLCFNPKLIEITDEKKKVDILATYDKMCRECRSIDFKKLFATILRYLCEELNVAEIAGKKLNALVSVFDFLLCDQAEYIEYIK